MRMPDVTLTIRYLAENDTAERVVTVDEHGIARPAEAVHDLGLVVRRRKGDALDLRCIEVMPTMAVHIVAVGATVRGLALRRADALFLNGYNSWTDSVEHAPYAAMRGLAGVPQRVIDRWVLDNSGDYRFVEEDVRPGHQHGFGYGYVRHDDAVLLIGSTNEDSGYTVLRERFAQDAILLDKEPPARELAAGKRCELLSFVLAQGTLDDALTRWLSCAETPPRPCAPLVGFSSWYRHYGAISDDKLSVDLAAIRALLDGRNLGTCQVLFQIDDGYAKVGDWLSPDAARFPKGLAHFASECEDAGLMPGLWLAPFLVEKQSELAAAHPEWLLRDEQGMLVAAGGNWSGAWALDTTLPAVRTHIAHVMSVVTRDWGFRFLKLDFLYAACLVVRNGLNRGQLMADALCLLRASVPADTWFDLCGVPLVSAFGRTEFCRIGCDVGLSWDDVPHMRLLHRERVSTRRSLANTYGRAHLDGRVFRNDPDVFFLRHDVKLTDDQRLELLMADALRGGMLLTSDDVSQWDARQRSVFDRALELFVDRASGM